MSPLLIAFNLTPPPPERKQNHAEERFFLRPRKIAFSLAITRWRCQASKAAHPPARFSVCAALRLGRARFNPMQNDAIPLEQFPEIISRAAVRGLIQFPKIKGDGINRTARIQAHAKLLWKGLDDEEKAIALGVSFTEFVKAKESPPLPVLD